MPLRPPPPPPPKCTPDVTRKGYNVVSCDATMNCATENMIYLICGIQYVGETRMHVHFSISMTTMNQNWPQALFYIATSSLLKLANCTVYEGETDFSVSMRAMTKNGLEHFSV